MAHQNFRSLNNKLDKLYSLLNNFKLDLLCISETWLNNNELFPVPANYNIIRKDRPSRGGGVAIVYKNELKLKNLEVDTVDWKQPHSLEFLCISLQVNFNKSLIICVLYRTKYLKNDLSNLSRLFKWLNSFQKPVICLGDLNINFTNCNDSKSFNGILTRFNLMQLCQSPTRLENCLDPLIVNQGASSNVSQIMILDESVSDHCLVYFRYAYKEKKNKQAKKVIADYNKIDWERFINCTVTNCKNFQTDKIGYTLSDTCNFITDTITTIFDSCVPSRKIRIRSNNDVYFSLSERTLRLKKIKQFYHRQLKSQNSGWFKTMFIKYGRLVSKSITEDAKNSLENICVKNKGVWGVLDKLNIKVKPECESQCSIKPDTLNKFYVNMGFTDDQTPYDTLCNYIPSVTNPKFVMPKVTEMEVFSAWKEFKKKSKKSKDPCGISRFMLNVMLPIPYFLEIVTTFCNQSFSLNKIPESLKTSKIVPIPKVKNAKSCEQYRPISIGSNLLLILEKLYLKKLSNYLNNNKLLSNNQFGFRQKHSTEHAVIAITDFIRSAVDKGLACVVVAIDLRRGFDSCHRGKVLGKLSAEFGIDDKWLHSYLSDRKQFVEINGIKSKSMKSFIGLPAGSILAPCLFALYLNDLAKVEGLDLCIAYADDSTLIFIGSPHDLLKLRAKVEEGMKNVYTYFKNHELTLNVAKTNMITVTSPKTQSLVDKFEFLLNGCVTSNSKTLKCLGIILDPTLSFTSHVNSIAGVCYGRIKVLYKIRNLISNDSLKIISRALILSVLHYMICVWGVCNKKVLKIGDKVVKCLARLVLGIRKRDSVTERMKAELNWLPLSQTCDFRTLSIMYCIETLNSVPYFEYLREKSSDIHGYETRHCNNLRVDKSKTLYGSRRFSERAVDLWNQLPELIRKSKSLPTFKSVLLKQYLNQ